MKKFTLSLLVTLLSFAFNAYSQTALTEDFSGGILPTGWTSESVSAGDSWEYGQLVDFGTTSLVRDDASGNNGEYANIDFSDDPDTTSIITPEVSVSGYSNPRLTFFYNTQTTNTTFTPYNRLILDYWDGASWVNITVIDTLTTLGWTQYEFDISTYKYGTDSVRFRFSAQEGGAAIGGTGTATFDQDIMLDEVVIEQTPSCLKPTNLTEMNLSSDSVDIHWVENNAATSWEIEYGAGTATVVNTDTFTTISGLAENTTYTYNVRAICAVGDTSAWASGTFTTLCAAKAVPYTETFNSASTTEGCWTILNENADADSWSLDYAFNTYEGDQVLSIDTWFNNGNNDDYAISPPITVANNERLIYFTRNANTIDITDYEVLVSTTGTNPSDFTDTLLRDTVGVTTYAERIVDLSAYSGTIYVAFHVPTGGLAGERLYIDQVLFEEIPSCLKIRDGLALGNYTDSTADFSWIDPNAATEWEVQIDTAGTAAGAGSSVIVTNDTATLSGLVIGDTYDVYVRAICAIGDSSVWSEVTTFNFQGSPLNGTYTINSAAATAGTNFASFADFTSKLGGAGVSGAVTVNVVAASGPYSEQAIFTAYNGASAMTDVTINGNGETISYAGDFTERRTIGFDGASYISIKNLTIETADVTYGWGIHMWNGTHHITLDSLNIDISSVTSTSSSNSAGIISSGSLTSAFTGGNNASHISISNSIIDGGTLGGMYYGMRFQGFSSADEDSSITISNNVISNFYQYGIYLDDIVGAIVDGNELHRGDKVTVGFGFYGITTQGGTENSVFRANRIHNSHGSASSTTGAAYGLYQTSNDADVASPNKWYNNIIYDFNGNGTIYAIYNFSSNSQQYYHNTVSLDHTAATGGLTRAFYFTSSPTNTDVRNNIISITRGGGGIKHGIYFTTSSTTFTCDYNDVYIDGGNYGYYSGDQSTLTDWRAANTGSYGANSIDVTPDFVAYDTLIPTSFAPDNSGIDLTATVANDFFGIARTATPDMGAIEFTGPMCPKPRSLATGNPTNNSIDVSWTEYGSATSWNIEFGVTNFSIGTGTNYNVSNDTITLAGLTIGTTYDVYIRALCSTTAGDTSLWSDVITFTFSGSPLNGLYTINSALATTGRNFASFADFESALSQTGVDAAVTAEVVAGSGPYDEQVIFSSYAGVSSTNTITIKGNEETLSFNATSTDKRILGFDGAKHFTIDSLTIEATNATYGYGVHFKNASDSISIINCTIDMSAITSAGFNNSAGIVASNSNTSFTTAGDNANYLNIDNNKIMGGVSGGPYHGIYLVGISSTVNNLGNSITNNTITDFYQYGIMMDDQEDAVVSGNDISRPTRTFVTTGYGIATAFGDGQNILIEKNAIHDLNTGDPTPTSTLYPIYLNSSDATSGNENVVRNNIIYNLNGTGTIYGIYNNGADYADIYHNTISLDDVNSTATGSTRGIFISFSVNNVDVQNNIVSISRGGSGAKHGIYFNGSSTTFTCDYNTVSMSSSGTGTQSYGYYNGTTYASLTDWQGANLGNYGTNSTAANPLLTSATDLTPGSNGPNNTGVDLLVADDYFGVARTATPDMGAIEFTPPSCIQPAGLYAYEVWSDTLKVSWTEAQSATEWEIEWDTAGFTAGMGTNSATVLTDTFTLLTGLSAQTDYHFYARAVCAVGDTSVWSPVLAFTTACEVVTVPYTETFNSSSSSVDCWTTINANSDFDSWALNYTGNPYEGDRVMSFYTWFNNGNNDDYAISPVVSLANNERLVYYVRGDDASLPNDYRILVSTTGNNAADFSDTLFIDTIGATTYEERVVSLDAYSGNVYVAFYIPNGGLPGRRLYIDNVTFEKIPSCFKVLDLTLDSLATDAARITWLDTNAATQWQVSWDTAGIAAGMGRFDSIVNTDTTFIVSSLLENTAYDVYVRAICSVGDTSAWAGGPLENGSFRTLCSPFGENFTETFNSNSSSESCWSFVNGNGDFRTFDPNRTFNTYAGDQALYMYTWQNGANDDYAITPTLTSTGNQRLRYYVRSQSATSTEYFNILVSTTGRDTADFSLAYADTVTSLDYEEHIVDLSAYSGDIFVAFHVQGGNTSTRELYIDEVTFEKIPTCFRVLDPRLDSGDQTTASVSWSDTSSASQWEIEYGLSGYTRGSGTRMIVNTDTFGTITGLLSNTAYDYNIRAICGAGDTASYVGSSFRTTCYAQALPYTETFNDTSSTESCWLYINDNDDTREFEIRTFNTYEGNGALYLYTWNNGNNDDYAVAPVMTASANERLRYFVRGQAATTTEYLQVKVSTTGRNPADFTDVVFYDTIATASYEERIVDLSGYSGDIYVAFHVVPNNFSTRELYIDSVTFEEIPACVAPTSLNAPDVRNITAEVSWTENGIAGEWEVEMDTAGFTLGTGRNTMTVNSNSAFFTGLDPVTDYEFYVRSICGIAVQSPWSDTGVFTTAACLPIVSPSAIPSTVSANVSWTDNGGATQWLLEYGAPNFTLGSGTSVLVSSTSTTVTGLTGNTDYDLYIRAICNPGDSSSWSDTVNFTTLPCGAVNGLSTTLISSNQANLSWNQVGVSSTWEVQYGSSGFTAGSGTSVMVNTTPSQIITGLSASTTYDWYVRGICGPGDTSVWSTVRSFTTIVPAAVTNLQSTVASNIADVSWTENGTAVEWEIEYDTAGFTLGTGNIAIVSNDFATLSSLLAFQDYDWYVRAISGPGDTAAVSAMASFTTFGITNQCNLTLKLEDSGNNGWQGNTIDVTIGTATTNYTLASGSERLITLPVDLGDSVILDYLRGGLFTTQVSFELIDANNGVIYSSGLNPALGVNYADTAKCPSCVNPSGLMMTSVSSDTAFISWTEEGGATEWELEWGAPGYTAGSANLMISNTTDTFITGLGSLEDYEMNVRAICGPLDTSGFPNRATFRSDFVCPMNAVCAGYTGADVSTDYDFRVLGDTSACPGSLVITVPAGNRLDSMSVTYDMTSHPVNFAWISEQRSWLYSPQSEFGEQSVTSGVGDVEGTYVYERGSLMFANKLEGDIVVEMHAGRALNFGPTGCGDDYISVDGSTWNMIAYYSASPACSEPIYLKTREVGNDTARISWIDYNAASYEIEYDLAGFTAGTGANSVIVTDTAATLSALTGFSTYDYYVRTICGAGDTSLWSERGSFTTLCGDASTALTASSITDVSADVSWTENGVSTQWIVEWDTAGYAVGFAANSMVVNTTTSTTLSGLSASTSYDFYVRPICAVGDTGVYSVVANFITECGIPVSLATSAVTTSSAVGSWTETSTSTSWEVEWDTAGFTAGTATNSIVVNTDTFATLSGLAPSTNYDWYVRAICGAGDTSLWSAVESFLSACGPAPSGLAVSANDDVTADVNWIENGSATTWSVEYGATGFATGTGSTVVVSTDTFTTLTGLTPSTTYDFYVRAICGAGDTSVYSVSASFTTICGVPVTLTTSGVESNQADLNWVELGAATSWQVQYDTAGFAVGTGRNTVIATSATVNAASLTSSTSYDFYVRSICGSGDTSLWSVVGSFTTLGCDAPLTLNTTNIGRDTVDVNWIEGGSATSWEISYGVTGVAADAGTKMVVTDTAQTLSGLSTSTGYDWYVRSICAVGDTSAWSAAASFTTGPCEIPTNLATSNIGRDTADVSWTENGDAASWEISYGATDFVVGTGTQMIVSATSETLSGLMTATGYDWYVRAICAVGDTSSWSDTASFMTAPCEIPTNLVTSNIGRDTVDISWTENGDAASWEISYGATDFAVGTGTQMIVTATSETISGLMTATGYDWYVRAICGAGDTSSWSDTSSFMTAPCEIPTNLVTSNIGRDTVDISWTENGDAASWEISYGATDFVVGTGTQMIVTATSETLSGLMTATGYDWYVRAICAVGDTSSWSDTASFMTAPCEIPTNLVTSNIGRDTVDISWTENGDAASWEISYGATDFAVGTGTQMIVTATSETISGLMTATGYDWYVRAICAVGDTSSWSDTSSFMTAPCEIPTNLVTSNIARDTADISWTENGDAASWEISYGATGFTVGTGTQRVVSATSETLSGLMTATGYDWYVRAICAVGDTSSWSDTSSFTTRDCSVPTALTTSDIGSDTVNVSWTENGSATEWEIEYDTAGFVQGTGSTMIVTSNPVTLTGLAANTDYDWYIRAICAAGDTSMWSDTSSFTTDMAVSVGDLANDEYIFNITPNPTNGEFSIRTSGFNNSSVQLIVRDMNGRILIDETIINANSTFQKEFDISDNAKGIYFISILDGNDVINEKLILQ